MAVASIAKSHTKWFSRKSLKLNIPLLHFNSKSSTASPSPPRSRLIKKTSSREDDYRTVFHYFDRDGDGKLSGNELRSYFVSVGEAITQDQAQRVISEFDADGDDLLEFYDFVHLVERDGSDGDLRRAFEEFEDEKGSGRITPRGLQLVLERLGSARSYEECAAMIGVFDLDGNGVLDFDEFNQMMAY